VAAVVIKVVIDSRNEGGRVTSCGTRNPDRTDLHEVFTNEPKEDVGHVVSGV
jgi:hypothetical protein